MNLIVHLLHSLSPLTDETKHAFSQIIQTSEIKKGTHLVRFKQVPENFYFIRKGLARVYYRHGKLDVTDYFAIDNQFIGALPALFTQTPSHKAIEVLEDSQIDYFAYADFDRLCLNHHTLERAARKMSIIGMLEGQKRIESIRFLSARERYEELEKLYPGITNRAQLKHIASYLGTTQVSISRIRAGKQ
jgi:signal-transduction protein with cAMP-binding, CBS, and nucleotidyltransferase domain